MKSTSDYRYAVPELFESLDGTARLFGLQRRRLPSCARSSGEHVGQTAGATLQTPASYTFQALRNRRNSLNAGDGRPTAERGEREFGLSGDRRDNPLRPQVIAGPPSEAAGRDWAGSQRISALNSAPTTQASEGRWIHLGLSLGVVTLWFRRHMRSSGSTRAATTPFAATNRVKRRRAGRMDCSSVRKRICSAISSSSRQTPNWSIVAFGDAIGIAAALSHYPFDERLYSVGWACAIKR
jgi:hypothetical protein